MKKTVTRLICLALAALLLAGCSQTDDPLIVTEVTAPEQDPVLTERRNAAESYMRGMATVLWRATEDLTWTKSVEIDTEEKLEAYDGDPMVIRAGRLYRGIPYSYSGTSAYNFYQYFTEQDDKGYPTVSGLSWHALNGSASHTARVGNDCSGAVQLAWESVGATFTPSSTKYMVLSNGFLPVGQYENDPDENIMTKQVCAENGGEVMFAAYAQLQKADAVVCRGESSGHTMMVTAVHVVCNDDGTIDGMNSYITVLHQTSGYLKKEAFEYDEVVGENVYQTYGVDDQYTFMDLLGSGYLPVTCDALVRADACKEFWVLDSEVTYDADNILEGTFTSSHMIGYVTMTVTNEMDEEVLRATCFAPRQTGHTIFSCDLSQFTTDRPELIRGSIELERLEPGKYHCTHILADAHGGEHVMRDFDFTVQ